MPKVPCPTWDMGTFRHSDEMMKVEHGQADMFATRNPTAIAIGRAKTSSMPSRPAVDPYQAGAPSIRALSASSPTRRIRAGCGLFWPRTARVARLSDTLLANGYSPFTPREAATTGPRLAAPDSQGSIRCSGEVASLVGRRRVEGLPPPYVSRESEPRTRGS
jgi:hypothetical protein